MRFCRGVTASTSHTSDVYWLTLARPLFEPSTQFHPSVDTSNHPKFGPVCRSRLSCGAPPPEITADSGSPRRCASSDVFSTHPKAREQMFWKRFRMASTRAPVGKSRTVTFPLQRQKWQTGKRQTGKSPSGQNIYSLESRVIHF